MEEVNECNEKLMYCLNKINILISKTDKLNSTIRMCNKNSEVLEIPKVKLNNILLDDLESLKDLFITLIENSYDKEEEIEKVKKEIDNNLEKIVEKIEKEDTDIEYNQNKEIYKKAIRLIYVAKWREKEKEISYLDYKLGFFDKITGEEKFRKLSIEKKKLESEIIKKEYYIMLEEYKGETVREIINKLNSSPDRDFELLDFKDKLIKTFMIDDDTITSQVELEWNLSNIIPYGFFEKIKYYKSINKHIEQDISKLKEKLDEYKKQSEKFIEKNEKTVEIFEKKIKKINEINSDIKQFIDCIKFA